MYQAELHVISKLDRLGGAERKSMGEYVEKEINEQDAAATVKNMLAEVNLSEDDLAWKGGQEPASHDSLRERIVRVEQYSRILESERNANLCADLVARENEKSGGASVDWPLVKQATIFTDIGKSGPYEADQKAQKVFLRLFSIERVPPQNQKKPLGFFIEHHVSQGERANVIKALKDLDINPEETSISDLWDDHIQWTYDILSRANIQPKVVETAVFHHAMRVLPSAYNKKELPTGETVFVDEDEQIVEFSREKKWVILLDMYEALRSRGGNGHAKAMGVLNEYLEQGGYLRESEFPRLLSVLDRACESWQPTSKVSQAI